MTRLLAFAFALVSLPIVACGDAEHTIGRIEFIDGPRRPRPGGAPARVAPPLDPPAPSPAPPAVAAFTADGAVAVVDGETGATLASSGASPPAAVRDVSYDRWAGRLVVFESDEEEQGGEIATYGLAGSSTEPALLAREHLAWVDGIARVAASPLGVLVFEDGYGPRWKVLWNDGTPSQGVAAGRPASLWTTVHSNGFMIHALTYGEASAMPMERLRAAVYSGELLDPEALPLGVAPTADPPTARLVPTPELGDAALLDMDGGAPVLRFVGALGAAPAITLDVGTPLGRIEHVVALRGGEVVVALCSDPAGLFAVRVAPSGAIGGASWLPLPGAARIESQFFSRDLVALGDERVLAATSAGVFAVAVELGGGPPELAFDTRFEGDALRGPLEVLDPR